MATNPGRGGGSRTPTSRPRRVAGTGRPRPEPVDDPTIEDPVVEETAAPSVVEAAAPPMVEEAGHSRLETPEDRAGLETWSRDPTLRPSSASVRLTVALVIVVVVLVAVAVAEAVYVWVPGDPVPSTARPVNADSVTTAATVDIAAKATQKIVASSYQTYDQQVDAAARTMTPAFAAKYRATKAQIKDRFVAQKTVVDVEITGQSVMSASDEQVEALIFLDQDTTKNGGGLTTTPYRARVTLVHTGSGWLVSDIALT